MTIDGNKVIYYLFLEFITRNYILFSLTNDTNFNLFFLYIFLLHFFMYNRLINNNIKLIN
jgi:hypothetical protein